MFNVFMVMVTVAPSKSYC